MTRQSRPARREVPGMAHMEPSWRAALAILAEAFPTDEDVWAGVQPGHVLDVRANAADEHRPLEDRILLVCAQGFITDDAMVSMSYLALLPDPKMRLVLDALAIARGGLPID